jgi:hypothetical protein
MRCLARVPAAKYIPFLPPMPHEQRTTNVDYKMFTIVQQEQQVE